MQDRIRRSTRRAASGLRSLVLRPKGDLVRLDYRTGTCSWRTLLVPDDCVVGLCRELILQDIYGQWSPPARSGLVVDAGAHVGTYALMAGQQASRVIALEADPQNYRILDMNVEANGSSNIRTVNAALWSEPGAVRFRRTPYTEGGAVSADGDVEIAAVTLDEIIESDGPVDRLKIDIEGAEFPVLSGTARLDDVRSIVGELHFTEQHEADALVGMLRQRGFEVQVIPEAELIRFKYLSVILRNWSNLKGHPVVKAAAVLHFLTGGALGAARFVSLKTPLFVATRTD